MISSGQTIYLDTNTPVLKGLIVQGGSLIFDDNQDVNLNAEYILVTDGGSLQVGTKENPFMHKATITLYGSIASTQLPIYGSKVLGLRSGLIDLHGSPIGITWTYLASTANSGSNQITLKDSVQWPIDGQIVITTTGDKNSQSQSETNYIRNISLDGKTLTLKNPLNFKHLSILRTVGGVSVYIRAEVGLLSRNVIFNAVNNDYSYNAQSDCNAQSDNEDGKFIFILILTFQSETIFITK